MSAPLDQDRNVLVNRLRADVAPVETPSPEGGGPSNLSFEGLYEQRFEDVSRWVRALGAAEADRDDLVQEIFLVVHRRLAAFDGQNVTGWLYQIARRKVRDHRRLLWVKHLFGKTSLPLVDAMLTTRHGALDELETKQKRELLGQLLEKLNEDQRAAFVLFEIEGRPGAEIAQISGVPLSTVWLRLHRARKALHQRGARAARSEARAL